MTLSRNYDKFLAKLQYKQIGQKLAWDNVQTKLENAVVSLDKDWPVKPLSCCHPARESSIPKQRPMPKCKTR
ncbi:hypothetical protein NQ317_008794 [Molorchus minor]|uniref:Uncharacterized protein n=1 Tax=Molorchus minor TaxID=1323400 RepID=A0ABQ9ITB8_9CUCU|nr:hypothetical protein NQ317_008794 [Molorchus minor]